MCCLSKHDHSLLTGLAALIIISTETNTQKKKCKSDYVTSNHTLIPQRLPCCSPTALHTLALAFRSVLIFYLSALAPSSSQIHLCSRTTELVLPQSLFTCHSLFLECFPPRAPAVLRLALSHPSNISLTEVILGRSDSWPPRVRWSCTPSHSRCLSHRPLISILALVTGRNSLSFFFTCLLYAQEAKDLARFLFYYVSTASHGPDTQSGLNKYLLKEK